jgi:uncharacterized protein
MDIILFTLGAFTFAVSIMSVGVLLKRKPIQGSCGGIASLMGSCDICEKKSECIDKIKDLSNQCSTDDCH